MEEQLIMFPDELPDSSVQAELEFTTAGAVAWRVAPSVDADIARVWGLPLRERVRVTLRGHALALITGRLELTRLPDLPFDAHTPLGLCIGTETFTSRQIISWVLVE
jgi:hypothetical protein